jgi:hypothetical protein
MRRTRAAVAVLPGAAAPTCRITVEGREVDRSTGVPGAPVTCTTTLEK